MPKKRKHLSKSDKIKAVALAEKTTCANAARRFGVSTASVSNWKRKMGDSFKGATRKAHRPDNYANEEALKEKVRMLTEENEKLKKVILVSVFESFCHRNDIDFSSVEV